MIGSGDHSFARFRLARTARIVYKGLHNPGSAEGRSFLIRRDGSGSCRPCEPGLAEPHFARRVVGTPPPTSGGGVLAGVRKPLARPALPFYAERSFLQTPVPSEGMKATLDVVLFLFSSIAVGAATVGGVAITACAVVGGGCWWWLRHRRP